MNVKESDWKLLKKLLPLWQENYIEKLIEEYKNILNKDDIASNKFWDLNKKIKEDKKNPGVLITDLRRSNMDLVIASLISNKVIEFEDLKDFSDELKETLKLMFGYNL